MSDPAPNGLKSRLHGVLAAWEALGKDNWQKLGLDFGEVLSRRSNVMAQIIEVARELLPTLPDEPSEKPAARLLYGIGRDPYQRGKVCARTYDELKENAYPESWREGEPLYLHPPRYPNEAYRDGVAQLVRQVAAISCDQEVSNCIQEAKRLLAGIPDETGGMRAAMQRLADAADAVGVSYFDGDDLSPEVEEMQAATLAARAFLSPPNAGG